MAGAGKLGVTHIAVALGAWFALGGQAAADERILSFHSDIVVHEDGVLSVTETIKVRAEGVNIKRGIFRDFPTEHRGRFHQRVVVGFHVLQVLRDGEPEPYHEKKMGNGVRVYMGSPEVLLQPGVYTYVLRYDTTRQLGFFEKHDELYYNVTGNGWAFPMTRASATVKLSPTVVLSEVRLEGFTGPRNSKATDYKAHDESDGTIWFETTKPLGAREGLTIVVMWPKGQVIRPSLIGQAGDFLGDNRSLAGYFLGLLLLLIYYVATWIRVGRDPEKGTIIPRFSPPDHVSPGAARLLMRMKYDQKCFAAALINLAVKRHIKLGKELGDYVVTRTGSHSQEDLSLGERRVLANLLKPRTSIKLTSSNHFTIDAAVTSLEQTLEEEYDKRYFSLNRRHMWPGVVLAFVLCLCLLLDGRHTFQATASVGVLGGVAAFFFWLWRPAVKSWWKKASFRRKLERSFVVLLGLAPFVFFFVLLQAHEVLHWALHPALIAFLAPVLLTGLFYYLMKAPTRVGRRLMDHLEGFKMYLSIGERDRLDHIKAPEKTPELFETFLPFALALDVEQEWAEQFAEVLKEAAISGESYTPVWYDANDLDFTRGLGAALAESVGSARQAPPSTNSGGGGWTGGSGDSFSGGSFSGGGGGGYSGGGGGGGGGGGW